MYTYDMEIKHDGIPSNIPIKNLIDRLIQSAARESFFKPFRTATKKKGLSSKGFYELLSVKLIEDFGDFSDYIPSEYKNKEIPEVLQALLILLCPQARFDFEDHVFKLNKPESSPSIILLKRFFEVTNGLFEDEMFSDTDFNIGDVKISKDYARYSVKESDVEVRLIEMQMSGMELNPILKLTHASSVVFIDESCNVSAQSAYISAAIDSSCIDRINYILELISDGGSFDNQDAVLAHTANAIYAIASLCKCQVIINLAVEMYPFLLPFFDGVEISNFDWFGFSYDDFVDIAFCSSCLGMIESNMDQAKKALNSGFYRLPIHQRAALLLPASRASQVMLRKMEEVVIRNSNIISSRLQIRAENLINKISNSWKSDGTDFFLTIKRSLTSLFTLINRESEDLLMQSLTTVIDSLTENYDDLSFEDDSVEAKVDIIKKLSEMVSEGKGFDKKMIETLHSGVNNSIALNNSKKNNISSVIDSISSEIKRQVRSFSNMKEDIYGGSKTSKNDDGLDSIVNENHRLEKEVEAKTREIESLNRALSAKSNMIESLASKPIYSGYVEKELSSALLDYIEESKQFTPEKALMIAGSVCSGMDILKSAVDSAKESSDFSQTPRLLKKLIVLGGEYLNAVNSGTPDAEARKLFSSKEFAANESETTMSNIEMRRDRKYAYNGEEHLFEQHLRIGVDSASANAIRVYFKVIDRRMVIAYCGPHKDLLRTV